MPARGVPLTCPFDAPPGQGVMLFPVKSSVQGNAPPFIPGLIHVWVHLPPKSPKLDAAALILRVVKLTHGPAGGICWQAPSISEAFTLSVQCTVGLPPFGPAS